MANTVPLCIEVLTDILQKKVNEESWRQNVFQFEEEVVQSNEWNFLPSNVILFLWLSYNDY